MVVVPIVCCMHRRGTAPARVSQGRSLTEVIEVS
jgi:hypothetical protein